MLFRKTNGFLLQISKLITRRLSDTCKISSSSKLSSEEMTKIEAAFQKLHTSKSKSLLKKNLTPDVFASIKTKQTSMGSNILDCIQSGVENLDSGVGVYAADEEAYTVFKDLFDGVICDYHGFSPCSTHPESDWGSTKEIANLDPEGKYVVSTRARCGRSIVGFPFNPKMTEDHYLELECKAVQELCKLTGELEGKFYPLVGMKKEDQQQLIDDHFLFKEGDRFLQAANANRFWPKGRGIFYNNNKTLLVWVNEEDHLRIISMQKGGDLQCVYGRLMQAAQELECVLPFSRSERLGYLTFCPTNLGTSIRASVHIKLPKLASDEKVLHTTAAKYNLQVRGTSGEHTESKGGVYDISNKRRLGLTEIEAIKEMSDGILALIKIEKSM